MVTRKARSLPAPLERLRRRFDSWRSTHQVRSRLPEPLWRLAVRMAGRFGLNRTAKALRLDYYVLKKRVQRAGIALADPPEAGIPAFVELSPAPSAVAYGACQCLMELENAAGARMRIQLTNSAMPDLAALSQTFWNGRP